VTVPFQLSANDKFSLIALHRCFHQIKEETELSDGTWVLPKMPVAMDEWWVRRIGEIRAEKLTQANFVLLRTVPSQNPHIVDDEHETLQSDLADLFTMLQLSGVVYYDDGLFVGGSQVGPHAEIRRVGTQRRFFIGNKAPQYPVTQDRLEEAVASAKVWRALLSGQTHARFRRGLVVLRDGLLCWSGQDRIQNFMRALEALMMPRLKKTASDIQHRGQSLGRRSKDADRMLYEGYQMRCDAEHMHSVFRKLREAYPKANDEFLDAISSVRTRQMEALARESYRRILTTPAILKHFENDASIEAFWALQEHHRLAIWGKPIDVTGFKSNDEETEKRRQLKQKYGT
jgi:hypothetical protein